PPRRSVRAALGPCPTSTMHRRHANERYTVRPSGGSSWSPYTGQGVHVTMAIDVRDAHADGAQRGELRGALLRHVVGIDAPGERARDEAGQTVKPAGARVDQTAATTHRLPGDEVEVQPGTELRARAAERRDRVLPAGRIHEHRDGRHHPRGVRLQDA